MRGETPHFNTPLRIGGIGRPLPRQGSKPLDAGAGCGPTGALAIIKEHARPVRLTS